MTDLTDQLDAIQARKNAATPGPWRVDEGEVRDEDFGNVVGTIWPHGAPTRQLKLDPNDAEFIANAPTDIGFLLVLARKQQAAIDAVRALHIEDLFRGHLSNGCRICGGGVGWPCPTIKALEAKP